MFIRTVITKAEDRLIFEGKKKSLMKKRFCARSGPPVHQQLRIKGHVTANHEPRKLSIRLPSRFGIRGHGQYRSYSRMYRSGICRRHGLSMDGTSGPSFPQQYRKDPRGQTRKPEPSPQKLPRPGSRPPWQDARGHCHCTREFCSDEAVQPTGARRASPTRRIRATTR